MRLERVTIYQLPAGVVGEVDDDVLAVLVAELGVTDRPGGVADTESGHQDTPLGGDIPAGDPGHPDWLVSAGPHQVGAADVEVDVDVVQGGSVEASLLANLTTQRSALPSLCGWVAVSVLSWLTDGHLLTGALMAVLNLQTAPRHLLHLHLLPVLTHLPVHQLLLLATDRPGEAVALLHLLHSLDLHLLLSAGRLDAGLADTSNLHH